MSGGAERRLLERLVAEFGRVLEDEFGGAGADGARGPIWNEHSNEQEPAPCDKAWPVLGEARRYLGLADDEWPL